MKRRFWRGPHKRKNKGQGSEDLTSILPPEECRERSSAGTGAMNGIQKALMKIVVVAKISVRSSLL